MEIIQIASRTKSRLLFNKLDLRPWVLESIQPFMESERPGVCIAYLKPIGGKSEYWLLSFLSNLTAKFVRFKGRVIQRAVIRAALPVSAVLVLS